MFLPAWLLCRGQIARLTVRQKRQFTRYTQSLRYQLKETSIQVIEIIPPYVQTDMAGPKVDPRAMPIRDFIAETMQILKNSPGAGEICVERVKARRFAEANGDYDSLFKTFNDALAAAATAS